MSDSQMEKMLLPILSVLDSEEVLDSTQEDYPKRLNCLEHWDEVTCHPGLDHDTLSALFNAIPKDVITITDEEREKSGRIDITSAKGYEYRFFATYLITDDRRFMSETIAVDRRIANENFCEQVDLYRKTRNAAPLVGDAETIAKRVISRLFETETEADKWTFGGSFAAEAEALFRKIPRQRCEHKEHTIYERGEIIVLGDDGLEYIFTTHSSADCGGSEWYDQHWLGVKCAASGLARGLYNHSEYSR